MFSILIPLERLKRTVTHCQKMDEWLAVKAGRYPRFFFRGGVPEGSEIIAGHGRVEAAKLLRMESEIN